MNELPTFEETWGYMLNRMNDSQLMKHIRSQLHLTQAEMANKLGYSSQEVISAIETGKRNMGKPTKAHLETIEKHEIES